jgi:type II secretory pathway pseudopilin PulG
MQSGDSGLEPVMRLDNRQNQKGFGYIGVLFLVAVMMLTMGGIAQVWHAGMQRENEKELLFIGHQFRNAIDNYYSQSGRRFPPTLEALLGSDNAQIKLPRYLRKIYRDPMTSDDNWGLVLGANGGIIGVHSLSEKSPYKVSGFSQPDSGFEGAEKYSDWKFISLPKVAGSRLSQGGASNESGRPAPRR